MKNFILILVVSGILLQCHGDKKYGDNIISSNSDMNQDSSNTELHMESRDSAPKIQPLNEKLAKGKVIFKQNQLTLLSFDTFSQEGKVLIDGKEYLLNKLIFTENNYEISGNGIRIFAEDGIFQDPENDCLTGTFPIVKIKLNDKDITLKNIQLHDCPTY